MNSISIPIVSSIKGISSGLLDFLPIGQKASIDFPTCDQNAYGLKIVGNGLAPKYNHDEIIVVLPGKELTPGCDVYMQTDMGEKIICILNWIQPDQIEVSPLDHFSSPAIYKKTEIETLASVQPVKQL